MNNNKIYNAMGFVEALIAIIITGMASVVLMQMAGSTLKEAVQNDKMDKMTMYAVEGANITREIIGEKDVTFYSNFVNQGQCYIPVTTDGKSWDFFKRINIFVSTERREIVDEGTNTLKRGSDFFIQNSKDASVRELIGEELAETQYFRIACLFWAEGQDYMKVEIFVAHMPSSGTITNDTEIKDYSYFTTVKIEDD